jgi:hypothetical protein
MVTKRTGRPRGRPRQPPKPKRDIGRPRLRLSEDPDRYAVACIDAMLALKLGRERACVLALSTWNVAVAGDEPKLSTDGRLVLNWEKYQTLPGAAAGTVEGRAATLREKRRRYRSSVDIAWRTAVGVAFRAAFEIPNQEMAKQVAVAAATLAGEADYARRVLSSLIDDAARLNGGFRIHPTVPEIA